MDPLQAALRRKRLWQYYDLAFGPIKPDTVRCYSGIVRAYASRPIRDILVVGCGTGQLLVALGRREYTVTGLESDKTALAAARRRCQGAELRARLIERSLLAWTPDADYDAVLAPRNGFKRLSDYTALKRCLARAASVLRPGGIMLLELSFEPVDWRGREWDKEETLRVHVPPVSFTGPGIVGQYRGYVAAPDLTKGRAVFLEEFTVQDCADKVCLREQSPWLLFSAAEFVQLVLATDLIESPAFFNPAAAEPTPLDQSVFDLTGGSCLFACRRKR